MGRTVAEARLPTADRLPYNPGPFGGPGASRDGEAGELESSLSLRGANCLAPVSRPFREGKGLGVRQ